MYTLISRSGLVLLTFLIAACGTEWLSSGGDDDPLFLVQKPVVGDRVVMEALYQGSVVEVGSCLRLRGEGLDSHTVVWPPGFSLVRQAGRHVVRDDKGKSIGVVGGTFKLGGGEVPTLWEDGPVDETARAAALSQCPGRYWLVGEIPSQ